MQPQDVANTALPSESRPPIAMHVSAATLTVLFVTSTVALDPAGSPGKSRDGQTPSGLGVPEPQSCEADGTCEEPVVMADPPAPVPDWFRPGSAEHVSPELYEQINVNLTALNTSATARPKKNLKPVVNI